MNTRERILEGFKELAFTAGFHAATMDELSIRAGVSKRTIYRHFDSKDEMINAVMDEFMSVTEKKVNSVLASVENPVEKIFNVVGIASQNLKIINPAIMRDMQKYYPHVWKRIEKFRAERVQSIIEEILLTGIRQGCFRNIIPRVFITALQASIRDVLNPGFILENNLTLDKAMFGLFEIFLHGIVAGEVKKDRQKQLSDNEL